MLALGIDPGTAICGYGVVDMTGNRLRPVFYGSVLTDKDMQPELRLKKIYDDISDIIDHFHPDFLSVEKLFFNRNVTTFPLMSLSFICPPAICASTLYSGRK